MEAITRQMDSGRDEAVARASAYLQCVGLPAGHAEAQARSLIEQHGTQAGEAQQDAAACALAEVMSRYEEWLDYLRRHADENGPGRGALLAWRLRTLLAADPSAFLRRGELPDALRLAVREATRPSVPEAAPAPMPAQPFGDLPPPFRGGFWRRVGARLASWKRGLACWIGGG